MGVLAAFQIPSPLRCWSVSSVVRPLLSEPHSAPVRVWILDWPAGILTDTLCCVLLTGCPQAGPAGLESRVPVRLHVIAHDNSC